MVAMESEMQRLRAVADSIATEGATGGKELVLRQCGIGKVNAAVGAVELIRSCAPDVIISTGVAGGADASLSVADVVVGTNYVYHDAYCGFDNAMGQIQGLPPRFAAPEALIGKALSLNAEASVDGPRIHAGLMVTGDWFVDTQEKMRSILATFPEAKAVDMESCAIAQVCHLYGVPFVSFRIISDIPLKENNAAQYEDFWATIANRSFAVTKNFLSLL